MRKLSVEVDEKVLPTIMLSKPHKTDIIDGSYQLGLPTLSRSNSSSSSEGPSSSRPREAPAARIRRLKAELEEIERELRSTPDRHEIQEGEASSSRLDVKKRKSVLPPRKGVDLVEEMSGLRKRLEGLDKVDTDGSQRAGGSSNGAEERLRHLSVKGISANGDETGDSHTQNKDEIDKEAGSSDLNVSDLDRRLASLEEILGSTGEGLDQVSSYILNT